MSVENAAAYRSMIGRQSAGDGDMVVHIYSRRMAYFAQTVDLIGA
jgi:hypothetical protein